MLQFTSLPVSRLLPRASLVAIVLSVATAIAASLMSARADTITLKSGETLEGTIVSESEDAVRIEVQVTPSIKETKTIVMADIATIQKTAPDQLAFEELQASMPAPPLLSSSDYDNMIRVGPARFLSNFPDSQHRAAVEAMLETLKSEKARVQAGSIKVGDQWISREERQLYSFAVEARIRHSQMRSKIEDDNWLGALRDFEALEERYAETPAHAAAVPEAIEAVKAWGSDLERRLGNVDFLNQRDEEMLQNAKEDERRRVEEARAAEKEQFTQALAREREQGIVWTSVDFRDKESLESAIAIATRELERLNAIGIGALTAKADALYDANGLIGAGKLEEARAKVAAVSGTSKVSSDEPTSYSRQLVQQIAREEETLAAAAAAVVAANPPAADTPSDADGKGDKEKNKGDGDDGGKGSAADGDDPEASEDKPMTRAEMIAAERAREDARKAAEEEKEQAKGKSRSGDSKRDDEDDEGDGAGDGEDAGDSGGGFNFQMIIYIVAGLLVLTVVALKVFGVGGAGGQQGKPKKKKARKKPAEEEATSVEEGEEEGEPGDYLS